MGQKVAKPQNKTRECVRGRRARGRGRKEDRGAGGPGGTCSGSGCCAPLPSGAPPSVTACLSPESAPVQLFTPLTAANSTGQGVSFFQKASLPAHNGMNRIFISDD